jgi:hypothetical protein
MAVKQARVAGWRDIPDGFSGAKRAEHRVIETLRSLDVVGTDHDVVEHAGILL